MRLAPFIRRIVVASLFLALLLAVALAWLLHSASGRDFVLQQLRAQLPAGSQLHWEAAHGHLNGPLQMQGLRLDIPKQRDGDCIPSAHSPCAMGRLRVQAQSLQWQLALLPLLRGKLQLASFQLQGAQLDLPRSDAPFKLPRWPEVLPTLDLPLTVQADAIRIDDLRITEESTPQLHIQQLRGGFLLQPGALQLHALRIDSDHGQLRADGSYAPRNHYRSNLQAHAVLPAPTGHSQPQLHLHAQGDLHQLVLTLEGNAPAPLHARLTLAGATDAPHWQLQARSNNLDPMLLAGSGAISTPLSFALDAQGIGGRAEVHGRLQQGETSLVLQPSTLSLQQQRLRLHSLVVDTLGGRITANGHADLRDPGATSLQLAVGARGLRWQGADAATSVTGDADLQLSGTLDRWTATGKAKLLRGKELAQLQVDGQGGRNSVQLRTLQVQMPQGRLQATGMLAWAPVVQWTANASLAGFDPGYFAPDWPGAIRGQLRSHGRVHDKQGLRAQLVVDDLAGQLRARALAGHGRLEIDGARYQGDVAVRLGASRIAARGTLASTLDLDAQFSPLQLNDLLPSGRGSVQGTLKLRGPRQAPDIDIDLVGSALAWADYRAEQLRAQGHLPWRTGNGHLDIDARGLQLGVPLHQLQASLRGAMARLQLQAQAQGDAGVVTLSGNALNQGAHWKGQLSQLQLTPTQGSAWMLQQPAQWAWDGQRSQLHRSCLQATLGGTLCVTANWPQQGVQLEGQQLPLALATPWLPTRPEGRPWALDGELQLQAQLRPAGNSWRAEATVQSQYGALRDRPTARRTLFDYRDLALHTTLTPNRIDATLATTLARNGRLNAQLSTGWDAHAPLRGQLQAHTPELTWLELLSPDIVSPTGVLDVDLQLAGSRSRPLLGGTGQLQQLTAELPALGIGLHNSQLRLQARDDGNAVIQGQLQTGQGALQVDGTLGWQDDATPLQLQLHGNNVLLADTRQLRLLASPDLRLNYRAGSPLQLRGQVMVPEADIHLERLDMATTPSPDVVVLDPAHPQQASAPLQLDIDMQMALGKQVRLDGYGLKGSLSGTLQLQQAPQRAMRANGALNIAGRYRAYGQDLRITQGLLLWSNAAVDDPILDLRAEREIGDVIAGVQVKGRASTPVASVWSTPSMSQSEALAYLTLGRPLPSLSSAEMQQVDLAKTALNTGVGLLTAQLGAKIGLDDAGVSQSRALGAQVLGVGKYLSPKLYVSYGVSLLGTGQVVTLKYLLRKGFDIQIESSTVENRASVNWRKEK